VKITQVRHATLRIDYAGKRFLVDPMLAERGAYPGLEGSPNSHLSNPLVDLPAPADTLLDVDAVIVTHTHLDHWDDAAKRLVPKGLPVFVQDEKDAADIRAAGFGDTRVLGEATTFQGVTLSKTPGRHGTEAVYATIADMIGEVCGVVFTHPAEKTHYVAGDTIWHPHVAESLRTHAPEVVVVNCGDNQITGLGRVVMNAEDVAQVSEAAPGATIVASHMEGWNHATLSRPALREFLTAKRLTERVRVPDDGEALAF
jgi:L-ascorbate metabolism protein UlaG (beta-lactamase superfamily)